MLNISLDLLSLDELNELESEIKYLNGTIPYFKKKQKEKKVLQFRVDHFDEYTEAFLCIYNGDNEICEPWYKRIPIRFYNKNNVSDFYELKHINKIDHVCFQENITINSKVITVVITDTSEKILFSFPPKVLYLYNIFCVKGNLDD